MINHILEISYSTACLIVKVGKGQNQIHFVKKDRDYTFMSLSNVYILMGKAELGAALGFRKPFELQKNWTVQ